MMNYFNKSNSGQALVTLLIFVIIGMTVVVASAVFLLENTRSTTSTELGTSAYSIAQAGIEEGLLRILRNPAYTGTQPGQPLVIGDGQVEISYSSSSGLLTAIGKYQNNIRKIQVQTVYNNYILEEVSRKEVD